MPAGGLSGATVIDSLDTLYLMELKEEFEEAKAWVEESFHLNVVSQRPWGIRARRDWRDQLPAPPPPSPLRPRLPSRAFLEVGLHALMLRPIPSNQP